MSSEEKSEEITEEPQDRGLQSESIDEVKEHRAVNMTEEEFVDKVTEYQGSLDPNKNKFRVLKRNIVFDKVKQEDGSYKLIGKLSNGKFCFPDWNENEDNIVPGVPYICLIYEPKDEQGRYKSVAFAKIVCEENIPKLFLSGSGVARMIWRDDKGFHRPEKVSVNDTDLKILSKKPSPYHVRILKNILKAQNDLKFPYLLIVFRDNE